MPLTASDLVLSIPAMQGWSHDASIQSLAERISGKMATVLANNVGCAFSQLRSSIHSRKLYVMFEQILACDPKTDHEIPKDVYPIYRTFIDTAELTILKEGLDAITAQLIIGIKEHFLGQVKAHEELEAQNGWLSKQVYSLTQRVTELTKILRELLSEKATTTRRNQIKLNELMMTVNGYNRTNSISLNNDISFNYAASNDLVSTLPDKGLVEQLQQTIQSKDLTIRSLKNQIQILSSQLTETKARTRDLMSRSFSRQPIDMHLTQSNNARIELNSNERSPRASINLELARTGCFDGDPNITNLSSVTVSLASTPRASLSFCGLPQDIQSLMSSRPSVPDTQTSNQLEVGRQSCIPAPFQFTSPVLRKMQKEQQPFRMNAKNAVIDTQPTEQKPAHRFSIVPPLRLRPGFLMHSTRHKSACTSSFLSSAHSTPQDAIARSSIGSPRAFFTTRELSMKTYSSALPNEPPESYIDEQDKLKTNLDNCSYCSDSSSNDELSACRFDEKIDNNLVQYKPSSEQYTIGKLTDSTHKATQTDKRELIDLMYILEILPKEWMAIHSDSPWYRSCEIQCSPDVSICTSHVFSTDLDKIKELLKIKQIERVLTNILNQTDKRLLEVVSNNRQNLVSSSEESTSDATLPINFDNVQRSSMLRESFAEKMAPIISRKPLFPINSAKSTAYKETRFFNSARGTTTQEHFPLVKKRGSSSPRRSNNFFSPRSPNNQFNQIQHAKSSASKILGKRILPRFDGQGFIENIK